MQSWVNGESAETISVHDRGLYYGQGVFETILITQAQPRLLTAHLERLQKGASRLSIPLDFALIKNEIELFCSEFCSEEDKQVLRVNVTMGEGGRGYANPDEPKANRIISLHDYPKHKKSLWKKGVKIDLSPIKLSIQPDLAGIKHNNRLLQVLARNDWAKKWQEALMLDHKSNVISGTMSNLFVVKGGALNTPNLSMCGIAGVMRSQVLKIANELELNPLISTLSLNDIKQADELFLTNSIIGVWPIKRFQNYKFKGFPVSKAIYKRLQENEFI